MKHLAALAVVAALVVPVAPRAASRAPVRAAKGMVGSTDEHASRVGVDILKKGGNAVDAAVAVGFALAVTHPAAGNIGGGGLMLIRFADGRATAIDYREMAPARAHRDMFLDEKGNPVAERSLIGPLAAGVPGSVAGLAYAQKKYGKLKLAEILAPAIALAENGFDISHALASSLADDRKLLERFPETANIFVKNGRPYEPGDRLIQKDLAATLKAIAAEGPDAFYRGRIADLIAAEMTRSGGLITKEDLAAYKPVEREALRGTYRGYGIVGMPPISSGGIALIQFLNILEGYPIGELGHNSSKTMHLVAEAARRVYADRSEWLGDPAFFKVPVAGLISKRYAERLRAGIGQDHATPSASIKPGTPAAFESDQTTHYSVVDADGTAVATTTTLNGYYGSGQVVAGAGFLLNNEMDDFSAKPGSPNMFGLIGGKANEIAPYKRMLSSMTPTIVTKDERAFLVAGSPGGSRIITTVLQVIMNVIDHQMDVQEAVDAARFHHQWLPDEIRIERRGFPTDVIRALEAMGHNVKLGGDMGDVHAILIDPKTVVRLGASDPRMDGRTIGY
ncbi:MAG TPA: gamma-glutamyltransferase [Vicinamibacterales bacterium]|jgi:gamma-glutamyltranspeptidase/glutathione hydrolase|nr:gamma-glutamyltransferase [Vicinamibacterales bacterium]